MSLIGIVGATGAVGRACAHQLRAWHRGPLRIGGRDARRVAALADGLDAPVESSILELFDPARLAAFCDGCDTVVNCAGPAGVVGDTVARAARTAGAGYVDAAGDDPLYDAVGRLPWTGLRAALVSAGMAPGLTALLPRLLALRGFTKLDTLRAYVGGVDTFTHTAAVDFLGASREGYGEPGTAWRGGIRVAHALSRMDGQRLAYCSDPVTLQPYLSTETERAATRLGLTDVDWYSFFVGDRVPQALARVATADELCRAATLDAFGRAPYQLLAFTLTGSVDGAPGSRTLLCRASGASALTGAFAALAALAVADRLVPPGVHHAGEAIDPGWAQSRLRECAAVTALDVFDGDPSAADEEGVL